MHKTHISVVWCTQIFKRLNNTAIDILVADDEEQKKILRFFNGSSMSKLVRRGHTFFTFLLRDPLQKKKF